MGLVCVANLSVVCPAKLTAGFVFPLICTSPAISIDITELISPRILNPVVKPCEPDAASPNTVSKLVTFAIAALPFKKTTIPCSSGFAWVGKTENIALACESLFRLSLP